MLDTGGATPMLKVLSLFKRCVTLPAGQIVHTVLMQFQGSCDFASYLCDEL